jgi:membrane dipeptidase
MPLIVDAHLDLAWNILTYGRDYTQSAAQTRALERGTPIPARNHGDCLLGWPDFQRGQVGLIFATLFAAPWRGSEGDWETQVYQTGEDARRLYRQQVDLYYRLVDQHPDQFQLVFSKNDLRSVIHNWQPPAARIPADQAEGGHPVGLVMSMEGAEGVLSVGDLEDWWRLGVRLIGPAWMGTRYCGGTREPGPLTEEGKALLDGMASLNFVLDISHMDESAVLTALDRYPGRIIASHSNAAALLKGIDSNRHLSNTVISRLVERAGVIGVVPFNSFLRAGWRHPDGKHMVTLQAVVAQIDHICQIAGSAQHVGFGTDFDGGFGCQATPVEIDTIADLQKIAPLLSERGYSAQDIEAILGQNWLRVLQEVLP